MGRGDFSSMTLSCSSNLTIHKSRVRSSRPCVWSRPFMLQHGSTRILRSLERVSKIRRRKWKEYPRLLPPTSSNRNARTYASFSFDPIAIYDLKISHLDGLLPRQLAQDERCFGHEGTISYLGEIARKPVECHISSCIPGVFISCYCYLIIIPTTFPSS